MMDTSQPGNAPQDDLELTITELPAATRRGISPELDALTGRDLLLDFTTSAGRRYTGRSVENVSFRRASTGVIVEGWDPVKGCMRTVNLKTVTRMQCPALGLDTAQGGGGR